MDMVINAYEYGRAGKCVFMVRYMYAEIRKIRMQIEKEDRHRRRARYIHDYIHKRRNARNEHAH